MKPGLVKSRKEVGLMEQEDLVAQKGTFQQLRATAKVYDSLR